MNKPQITPLSILAGFMTKEGMDRIEETLAPIVDLPEIKPLSDLVTPDATTDGSELIANRFLYRGGICLLAGPTGIGKSSFLMQLGCHMACGEPFFGISPGHIYRGKGIKVLTIQAENDEGDMAEMRDGIMGGCDLPGEAYANHHVVTLATATGTKFGQVLSALLEGQDYDLVLIDPAFSYLGGNASDQKDVSAFMRNVLLPIAQHFNIGIILAHHTNKPLRGKEKDTWAAGDFAYIGAGSAEWVNASRACLAIRAIGSDSVFELRAAKRGKRLGWSDDQGEATNVRYIAHSSTPGVICWEEADPADVDELTAPATRGRKPTLDIDIVLDLIASEPGEAASFYVKKLKGEASEGTIRKRIRELVKLQLVTNDGGGNKSVLNPTEMAKNKGKTHE